MPEGTPRERVAPLVHLIVFSAVTALLVTTGPYLPFLGFWGLLICPLPLALLGYCDGEKWVSAGMLATAGFLFFAVSQMLAFYFMIGCAPFTWALYFVSRQRRGTKPRTGPESLLLCALASVVAKVMLLVMFWALTGNNLLVPDMGQVMRMLIRMYNGLDAENMAAVQQAVAQLAVMIPRMTPSLLVLYAGLEAVVNYALCLWALARLKVEHTLPPLPPLSRWRLPKSLLPVFFFSLLLAWLWNADAWLEGAMFVANLRLVLNVLFFVQGFSLALWWMERRQFRGLVRGFMVVLLLFPLMWPWVLFLGVLDMGFDFRERAERPKDEEDGTNGTDTKGESS